MNSNSSSRDSNQEEFDWTPSDITVNYGHPISRKEYCSARPERFVVCAANKYGGLVFTGVRHFCPVMVFNMQHYDIKVLRKEYGEVQGFIDQHGLFMDREQAAKIAAEAGQLDRYGDSKPKVLFSEDLY